MNLDPAKIALCYGSIIAWLLERGTWLDDTDPEPTSRIEFGAVRPPVDWSST